ncbi:MAG: dockerin type I repeat-containing protein [Oscillospiraceae bacterium]|nr:dockerin type I repeat-containing protein [Oscillospiraceae bacterium]
MLRRKILTSAMASVMALTSISAVAFADETATAAKNVKTKEDLKKLVTETYGDKYRSSEINDFGSVSADRMLAVLEFADEIVADNETDDNDATVAYDMVIAVKNQLKHYTASQLRDLMNQVKPIVDSNNINNEDLGDAIYDDTAYQALVDAYDEADSVIDSNDSNAITDAYLNLDAVKSPAALTAVSKSQFNQAIKALESALKNKNKYENWRRGSLGYTGGDAAGWFGWRFTASNTKSTITYGELYYFADKLIEDAAGEGVVDIYSEYDRFTEIKSASRTTDTLIVDAYKLADQLAQVLNSFEADDTNRASRSQINSLISEYNGRLVYEFAADNAYTLLSEVMAHDANLQIEMVDPTNVNKTTYIKASDRLDQLAAGRAPYSAASSLVTSGAQSALTAMEPILSDPENWWNGDAAETEGFQYNAVRYAVFHGDLTAEKIVEKVDAAGDLTDANAEIVETLAKVYADAIKAECTDGKSFKQNWDDVAWGESTENNIAKAVTDLNAVGAAAVTKYINDTFSNAKGVFLVTSADGTNKLIDATLRVKATAAFYLITDNNGVTRLSTSSTLGSNDKVAKRVNANVAVDLADYVTVTAAQVAGVDDHKSNAVVDDDSTNFTTLEVAYDVATKYLAEDFSAITALDTLEDIADPTKSNTKGYTMAYRALKYALNDRYDGDVAKYTRKDVTDLIDKCYDLIDDCGECALFADNIQNLVNARKVANAWIVEANKTKTYKDGTIVDGKTSTTVYKTLKDVYDRLENDTKAFAISYGQVYDLIADVENRRDEGELVLDDAGAALLEKVAYELATIQSPSDDLDDEAIDVDNRFLAYNRLATFEGNTYDLSYGGRTVTVSKNYDHLALRDDYNALYKLVNPEAGEFKVGDVDKNGAVNTLDAAAILKAIVDGTVDTLDKTLADFDANGVVNTLDAAAIKKAVVDGTV